MSESSLYIVLRKLRSVCFQGDAAVRSKPVHTTGTQGVTGTWVLGILGDKVSYGKGSENEAQDKRNKENS